MFIIEAGSTKRVEESIEDSFPELSPDDQEIANRILAKIEDMLTLTAINLTLKPYERIKAKMVLSSEEMRVVLNCMEIVK